MIRQKKGSRALWAVAFAAAPIGAHATPLNPPEPVCNSAGQLSEIGWKNGSFVGSKDTVIDAAVHGLLGVKSDTVPFVCSKSDTKGGVAGAGTNVFADLTLTKGDSFSIDFGDLNHTNTKGGVGVTKGGGTTTKGGGVIEDGIDYVPTYTAFDYTKTVGGIGGLKGGGVKGQLEWVTDFDLDLTATEVKTGQVLFQDFLGVQVISGGSALSAKDQYYFDDGQLIFDAPFTGETKVDLFSSPIPAPVPEPTGLALIATGLLGMAAAVRRRKKNGPGGGEPEA